MVQQGSKYSKYYVFYFCIYIGEKKRKKLLNCKLLIFLPLCRLRCVLVIGSAKTLQFHAPYVPLKLFVKYLW